MRTAVPVWQSLPAKRLEERPDYVKAYMDGTLGSRTARLLDGSGVEITSRDAFEEIVRAATAAGVPVAVHAIGDLANREALDAFAAVPARSGRGSNTPSACTPTTSRASPGSA